MPMASDELFLHALQAANRRRVGEMCKREPRADVNDCKWRRLEQFEGRRVQTRA